MAAPEIYITGTFFCQAEITPPPPSLFPPIRRFWICRQSPRSYSSQRSLVPGNLWIKFRTPAKILLEAKYLLAVLKPGHPYSSGIRREARGSSNCLRSLGIRKWNHRKETTTPGTGNSRPLKSETVPDIDSRSGVGSTVRPWPSPRFSSFPTLQLMYQPFCTLAPIRNVIKFSSSSLVGNLYS